jgi:hypothetical protein
MLLDEAHLIGACTVAVRSNGVRDAALGLKSATSFCEYTQIYAARSGRDIQLMIGIAGSTHPSPATT